MDAEAELGKVADQRSNCNSPYTFSPVTPSDTVGTLVLGLLATILLVALLRSHARYRKMLERLNEACAPAET